MSPIVRREINEDVEKLVGISKKITLENYDEFKASIFPVPERNV